MERKTSSKVSQEETFSSDDNGNDGSDLGFVHVVNPAKACLSLKEKCAPPQSKDCTSSSDESLVILETSDLDSISSNPMILDMPENCEVETQDSRTNGSEILSEKEVLGFSSTQTNGTSSSDGSLVILETSDLDSISSNPMILDMPEHCEMETQDSRPNGTETQSEKEVLGFSSTQTNGLVPPDDTSLKTELEKNDDMICVDPQDCHDSGDGITISSGPVIISIAGDDDMNSKVTQDQGHEDESDSSVSDLSRFNAERKKEAAQKTEEIKGDNAVPILVTSLTPLDDTYIRAVSEKNTNDMLFFDTQGGNKSADGKSSSSDPIVVDLAGEGDEIVLDKEYRDHSDSSVSDLSSFESDSDIEIEIEEIFRKGPHLNKCKEITTHGELTLKDLPPIQDLKISVPEEQCLEVGFVSSIVNELVVVQALPNRPALNLGTVLFMDSGKESLGEVFDVFGHVKEPYYAIRFNSADHARKRGVKEGMKVFCAPKTEYTSYVFMYDMLKMKGSDASWEHNHEPPVHCLDFSDDEEEKAARRKKSGNHSKDPKVGEANVGKVNSPSGIEETSRVLESDSQQVHPLPSVSNEPPTCRTIDHPIASQPPRVHWRQALPPSYLASHPSPPSTNGHSNAKDTCLGSLHPPGHPPLRNTQSSDWYGGGSALRSARRANVHLFREQQGYKPMHEGASPYPPMPTLSVSPGIPRQAVESSGPKRPLLPIPSPQQRLPLLPVPSASTWTFGSCPRPVFPSIPSSMNNPFSLPPPCPNGGQPFTRPPPIPPSLIPPRPRPDQGNQKPSPMVSSPVPSSPSPSYPISFHNPFTIPQPIAPHPLFSSFRGHFERRNSVPPSFPPPTQPPFISRQMAPPFVLRPSTLFPKPPPSAGPSQ